MCADRNLYGFFDSRLADDNNNNKSNTAVIYRCDIVRLFETKMPFYYHILCCDKMRPKPNRTKPSQRTHNFIMSLRLVLMHTKEHALKLKICTLNTCGSTFVFDAICYKFVCTY